MLEVLPEVLYHLESFDMYLVRSAVANYLLSRMAHKFGKTLYYAEKGVTNFCRLQLSEKI